MIRTDAWQAQTLEELHTYLEARPEVVALASYGSTAGPNRVDQWSDLDCLLVVDEKSFTQYYPSVVWLKTGPIGPVGRVAAQPLFSGRPPAFLAFHTGFGTPSPSLASAETHVPAADRIRRSRQPVLVQGDAG